MGTRTNVFDSIKIKVPKKSLFDLSHEFKFTGSLGRLIPILCQEVLPGDKFRVKSDVFMRFQPLIAPMMHRVDVYVHYFFVPNRLVFEEWESFITGGESGNEFPVLPYFTYSELKKRGLGMVSSKLVDYLGYPTINTDMDNEQTKINVVCPMHVNALPLRAYRLIWNEYYRDQNLQDEFPVSKSSGELTPEEYVSDDGQSIFDLCNRCWEHDYFTSALPWPQRGQDVYIPLAGTAPIVPTGEPMGFYADISSSGKNPVNLYGTGSARSLSIDNEVGGVIPIIPAWREGLEPFSADLSHVSASTINDLRVAFRLQEFLEKNARGGSRYIEQIFSHFGVRSSDARLQRPEYLGGGKQIVSISEVVQQSETTATSPQGNMAGHGISVGGTNRFDKFFEEHGFVIGILSVMPRTGYSQGMPRAYMRQDRFDYYWPEFAHLGEQEVWDAEINFRFDDNTAEQTLNSGLFGYQARYSEYKYCQDRVGGDFKNVQAFWHLSRMFKPNSKVPLNAEFVECHPSRRPFAIEDDSYDDCLFDVYHNIKALRMMPFYGTPIL